MITAARGSFPRAPASSSRLAAVVALATACTHVAYPASVALAARGHGRAALALLTVPVVAPLVRALASERIARLVRAEVFTALARLPGTFGAPHGGPSSSAARAVLAVARGVPWIELFHGTTVPSLAGLALATPFVAAWTLEQVATAPAALLFASAFAAGAVVAVASRRARRLLDASWAAYQPVADWLDLGFAARTEIAANALGPRYAAALDARVAAWEPAERAAYAGSALASRAAPAVVLVGVLVASAVTAGAPGEWLVAVLAGRHADLTRVGLAGLATLPLFGAASAHVTSLSEERPHLEALRDVLVTETEARPPAPRGADIGDVRVDVRHAFGRAEGPRVVARFAWPVRARVAVQGPTGAGKSTLAAMLVGALVPDVGAVTVHVAGAELPVAALSGRLAFLPQHAGFAAGQTARDAIRFFAPDVADARAEGLLAELARPRRAPSLDAMVASLSGGERRLVALARVLLSPAELLVLDEPEASLDATTRANVVRVLAAEARRWLVLTHDASIAALADVRVELAPSEGSAA